MHFTITSPPNGEGIELTPGKFRAAFMYGKFNDAVTDISLYNNLNNNIPLYKRTGFAAKIGYGSENNFLEFSYLQAKDDSASIPHSALDTVLIKPAANQVLGLLGQITLFKHLTIRTELAASAYTRDITADTASNVNSLLSKISFIAPCTSTMFAVAAEASLNYQFNKGNVNVKYRRVDPNYQSMGAFYMQTDVEQYTFGFSLAMFKKCTSSAVRSWH